MASAASILTSRHPRTRESPVYQALIQGLNEMDKQGVDRVVLALHEAEPSPTATRRWIDLGRNTYYPLEMLDETEQGLIKAEKTYTVAALVRDCVGDIMKYGERGLESYQRTRVIPFLSGLSSESQLNYVTEGGICSGVNLRTFSEQAEKDGWTPEAIKARVEGGIQEYRDITKKLMEKAGVYGTLRNMDEREHPPFEQILAEVRKNTAPGSKNDPHHP